MTDAYGVPKGPNSQLWFGADAAGRDLFVLTMYGARTSLFVGIVASGFAVLIGLVVGLTAGFFGGFVDTVLSCFSSRRRHTRLQGDWSSDVCSSDLPILSNQTSLRIPAGHSITGNHRRAMKGQGR